MHTFSEKIRNFFIKHLPNVIGGVIMSQQGKHVVGQDIGICVRTTDSQFSIQDVKMRH